MSVLLILILTVFQIIFGQSYSQLTQLNNNHQTQSTLPVAAPYAASPPVQQSQPPQDNRQTYQQKPDVHLHNQNQQQSSLNQQQMLPFGTQVSPSPTLSNNNYQNYNPSGNSNGPQVSYQASSPPAVVNFGTNRDATGHNMCPIPTINKNGLSCKCSCDMSSLSSASQMFKTRNGNEAESSNQQQVVKYVPILVTPDKRKDEDEPRDDYIQRDHRESHRHESSDGKRHRKFADTSPRSRYSKKRLDAADDDVDKRWL